MKSIAFVGVLTAAFLSAAVPADASESLSYRCKLDNLFVFVETIPEEGRAVFEDISGKTSLMPDGRGGYFNDGAGISFEGGNALKLWLGDVSHSCELAVAAPVHQANAGAAATPLNVQGQSLGGKLRSGPGMNFGQSGSLDEGTWLTILNNTGVSMNGFDWFEVATDNGLRGYQWGGIMCSNGEQIQGIYQACGGQAQVSGKYPQVAQGRGWMAFALAPNGKFGHGAAPTRAGAEQLAMNYCGSPQCRIVDATQAACHALATSPNSNGIGAGDSEQAANNFAMGWCSNNGAQDCRVQYSYCQ
ncbi:DUF4189 domain-containing protein [Roseibium sp. M-1]